MIYHQRHNKRQNTLASIKHLAPSLLPVNKGSKAIEQAKTQSLQPPPDKHTLQCVLSLVASSADVIYGQNGYASINLFAAALCLFLSKKLSREIEKKQCLFLLSVGRYNRAYTTAYPCVGNKCKLCFRTPQGKHKPPCIVRFHLLCRAAFFHIFNFLFGGDSYSSHCLLYHYVSTH